jgi:hypothetical protein
MAAFGALTAGLLALPGRAQADDQARPALDAARAPALALALGGGAVSPGTAALVGAISFTYPLGAIVALEVEGGSGYAAGGQGARPQFWLRLAAGAQVRLARGPVMPWLGARVVHVHAAATDVWLDHPGHSLAGDASHGLGHLTGLGATAGLAWDLPGTDGRCAALLEGEALWMVVGDAPPWTLTARLGALLRFG